MPTTQLDDFTQGYIECALWLADETPGPGEWAPHEPYVLENIDADDLQKMIKDCRSFQDGNMVDLSWAYEVTAGHAYMTPGKAGQDFFLSRNGHGAGFFDEDLGRIGDNLQRTARAYGESSLYVDDNGNLYLG